MVQKLPAERPLWVQVGLWGLASRASAWVFFWISLALAAGSVAYGFKDARFFAGAVFVLAALWYYAAIKWVDENGSWS